MIHGDVRHAVRIQVRHGGVTVSMNVFHSKRGSRGETGTNVVGGATYRLLRSLVAPANPNSKTLDELTALLKDHFELKANTISERFRFHRHSQH